MLFELLIMTILNRVLAHLSGTIHELRLNIVTLKTISTLQLLSYFIKLCKKKEKEMKQKLVFILEITSQQVWFLARSVIHGTIHGSR